MPISKIILERIETFRRNLDSYLSPDYEEAQVRQEFHQQDGEPSLSAAPIDLIARQLDDLCRDVDD